MISLRQLEKLFTVKEAKMAQVVIMPKQGLQMTEGVITKWLVREGEQVKEGEALFEMETDKLTIEIDAAISGTLLKILHPEGDTIPITKPIAVVGELGEDISEFIQKNEPAAVETAPETNERIPAAAVDNTKLKVGGANCSTPRARMRAEERKLDINVINGSGPDGLVIERDVLSYDIKAEKSGCASPLARRVSKVEGIELDGIKGTGSHGKIMSRDVIFAKSQTVCEEKLEDNIDAQNISALSERTDRKVPLTGMRKVIAKRMCESLYTMAQANHLMTVDMTEAVRLRGQLKRQDIKVSYNDIIMRCVAKALMDCPEMNVSYQEDGMIVHDYVNLGMAVAVENGLIVPVVKDADLMNIQQLHKACRDLAERAKNGQLQQQEYCGGTFTVSNLGMFDVDSFTPIVNPPEAGIIGVGKMGKRPVVLNDGSIAAKDQLQLSLTYDHRAVDGATAAIFLKRIKTLLENPALLV